jgi:hypothetical protein
MPHYKRRPQKREDKCLNFWYHIKLKIYSNNLRRYFMIKDVTCPICDADIPLDGDETSGDLVLCSYCKMTFKMLKKMDDWTLVEDFEE